MKLQRFLFLLLIACIFTVSFKTIKHKSDWTSLFNKKDFTGWDKYIGPDLDSTGKMISGKPVGLNNDPKRVFTIVKENGENIIRISGEAWGGISTKKEYENYHFQLKFKWGNLSWGQKKNKKKDSGLLYHAVGPHGADYGAWMRSQEFQIEEGNCGEYWGVAGGMQDIPAIQNADSDYVYNPAGKIYTFSANSRNGRHCRKAIDAEKPSGEWNTLDFYCHGDTSVHVINRKVMMVLYNSRQMENGQAMPLTKGKLQIQSEGAEVFYKEIKIQPLRQLPVELLK
jgi:hypothetical protein